MEMKINKTVNVEMDESLGYTMVFIKFDELKNNVLAEAIKQKTLESLQLFLGNKQIPDAYKECHVLTHWLDKGYLCYPAYENCLAYRPYNCGPRYIKVIDDILDKVNRRVGNEFLRMCEDLTSQITDRLDAIAKNVAAAESKKKAEQTGPQDASSEKFKKAVEKLGRRDVIFEQECVYLRTEGPSPGLVNTAPMANFLECAAGWDDSRSWHRFSMPLAEGKILLTPPTETEDGTNAYWNLLGTIVCEPIVREAKNIHDTLHEIMGKQSVLMAEKKLEQSASVGTPTPQEGQKETVGEPKQSGPKARLKAAVEKLGRKDVTYEYGHVYYQLKKWPCGCSVPMTNLWIRKTGLDTSTIQFRCTSPLMDGKVLLNLPPEIAQAEDAYWAILDPFIAPEVMEDIAAVQNEIHRVMEDQSASKVEKAQNPMYFQTQPYTSQASFVEDMRLLWQNNVCGLNMSSVEKAVLNPLHEGKISLLNDLPEVVAEFGPKYCGLLKYWLHPTVWAMFAAKWNKIHPDAKV